MHVKAAKEVALLLVNIKSLHKDMLSHLTCLFSSIFYISISSHIRHPQLRLHTLAPSTFLCFIPNQLPTCQRQVDKDHYLETRKA